MIEPKLMVRFREMKVRQSEREVSSVSDMKVDATDHVFSVAEGAEL